MTLRFESGAVGTVLLAWTAQGQPGSYSLDVLAPAATLRIKLDPAFTLSGQVGDEHVKEDDDRASVRAVRGTIRRGGEGRRPGRVFCTPRDALGTLATALACERSLLEGGRSVELAEVARVTMAGTTGLDAFFVPAAHTLPSNAAYLAHLAAAADDPSLIRLASNENSEPPSPRVRAALEEAFLDANLSPPPTPPLKLALAARHGVAPSQVLVTAGSTEVIDARLPHVRPRRQRGRDPEPVVARLPAPARRARGAHRRRSRSSARRTASATTSDRLRRRGHRRDAAHRRLQPEQPDRERDGDDRHPPSCATRASRCSSTRRTPTSIRTRDPMPLVHEYDNVIVTRTFSKAYCLAGVRVGYAVGAAERARSRRPLPRPGQLGQLAGAPRGPRGARGRGVPRPPGRADPRGA